MGLGVLEVKPDKLVAGTIPLRQDAVASESITRVLKRGSGASATIVLAPQPSEDPNDPLNWSYRRKFLIVAIIALGAVLHVSAAGALLTPGIVEISLEINRSITDVNKLAGYMQLATGAFGPFTSAFARKYGKRPVYVFASAMSVLGCILGETASGYGALVGSRVIQGISCSAYESLVVASIGDLFFAHERGPLIAMIIFIWTAVTPGVTIIAGPITTNLGWHFNFHILLPFVVVQLILAIFLVPETVYKRRDIYNIDTLSLDEDHQELGILDPQHDIEDDKQTVQNIETRAAESVSHVSLIPEQKTYWQEMTLYSGTFVGDSILKMVIACPCILFNAGVCYVVFAQGTSVCWLIATLMMAAVLFSSPPYFFTAAEIGYTSVGTLLGTLLASIFMALVSDRIIKRMSYKNRGIFEPEFHLPFTVIGTVCGIAGMIGMGYAAKKALNVYLICFLWGLESFGLCIVGISLSSYALAALRSYSTEVFMMNMVFRNFLGYGVANFVIDWLMAGGILQVLSVMAGITGAFCLLGLPVYVYGKRYRQFWSHHNLIKILHLESDKTGTEDSQLQNPSTV